MDKRKDRKKKDGGTQIADERFASFQTDPRFRLPSRKHMKTTVDKRFAGILKDSDFTATARVDRYGRKIASDSKKKALQRLYRLDDEEEEGGSDVDGDSDEDEADKPKKDDDGGEEEESEEEEEDVEVEDDEVVQRELDAAQGRPRRYDPAREGGFSSSEDSDSDEDADEEGLDLATGGDMQRLEREEVETGEVTNRIAIVNLDWDHVKSTDLMALFSSFIPANGSGSVLNVSIYPSEFGKERMQQEELEGPPKQLFRKGRKDEESESESEDASDSEAEEAAIKKKLIQEGDDQDFDSDALRAYQLDRLRYYYAVMTCSSKSTAQAIYEATDGTEYQASSNFIDLRFVPDEVTFDDEPRDECEKVPESYKPVEFVTNALQSSKVKLTWDMHPEEISRKESIKRAFKGSRAEIDEQDLKAYLAGDSGEDEDDADGADGAGDGEPKLSKKELARQRMREALGLAAEPESKKSKDLPVGDMEVTFTPALSGDGKRKKDEKEETTIEKYARKERERKEKKRQVAKAKREALNEDDGEDPEIIHGGGRGDGEDLGFDDPFFTTEDAAAGSKTSIRKEERRKKREAREAAEARDAEEKALLSKVMAEDAEDDRVDHLDHFDMNEILRAEKQRGKKKKYQKKGKAEAGLQDGFKMNVKDDRFKAIFESHEFAIDPSNPKFKATEGMKKLLEEGRRKRKMAVGGDDEERPSGKKSKTGRR
ncbi:pre-rrna processing esf1 [Trichoderma cornu-damae]|uniref:Pre-rrna processing esf1 n=1 Tax=Trichoderma cornu-damae TaxID=654480 RepID=A0A9P8QLI1_9HYPO|nr:pre-rrna processing esf1 [Trichoderma cornu-damae]